MTAIDLLTQDAALAAPQLLGWELRSTTAEGSVSGRIVEVEAYHGTIDPASHAYRRQTPRTKPMFDRAGTIYIYRSYGLHLCLNLVTGPADEAQAILIRALEPLTGIDVIMRRRKVTNVRLLLAGPGRVGQGLALTLEQSGTKLGPSLELLPPSQPVARANITITSRIGISAGKDLLWRFYETDSRYISRA